MWWMNDYMTQNNNVTTCPCISSSLSLFKWRCFVSTLGVILDYMGIKKTLLWIIYMIETRYRSLKKIHRTGVAVLHCPGCVLTSNLRCLDIFTSTRLWLLPIAGVAKNLGSSSLLSSFAGGETCNWRCFTVNWTTLHTTGLADMAQAYANCNNRVPSNTFSARWTSLLQHQMQSYYLGVVYMPLQLCDFYYFK